MSERGYFIVLEGLDGSGLTTQTALLRDWLAAHGHPVFATKEPSAGPMGAIIRWALTGRLGYPPAGRHGSPDAGPEHWQPLDDATMALLYAADRLDHVREDIAP